MRIYNVHERLIPGSMATAMALLDGLSSEDDRLWPKENWMTQRFDKPLQVGAKGGHGPIRYSVDAYDPGLLVHYKFDAGNVITGSHWFAITETEAGILFRHVINARANIGSRIQWVFMIRWLHDALLEDAFDKAEIALTGEVRNPSEWSLPVRLLRRWRSLPSRKKAYPTPST